MVVVRRVVVIGVLALCPVAVGAQELTLTLPEALARAREQAPAVVVARARIDEARGRLAGARVRFRDSPSLDVSTGPRSTEAGTLMDLDIGFSQVFETGGQRAARIAGAEAAIARETASSADVARLAMRDVALAFTRGLYAQERVTLLQSNEELAAEVLRIAERRFAAGDIAVLDANVAKASAARAKAARHAAEADQLALVGELKELLRLPPDRTTRLVGNMNPAGPPDPARLVRNIDNRPDLVALRAEIADAESDIRLGRGAARPDLGVGVQVKREEGHRAILGGLTVVFPAFNRGQELQATGAARAFRLRLELETRRDTALIEMQTAIDIVAARQAAVAAFEQSALGGATDNESLARRSFAVGQINLSELLLIRRELQDTRLEYLDRRREAAEAAVMRDAASGVWP